MHTTVLVLTLLLCFVGLCYAHPICLGNPIYHLGPNNLTFCTSYNNNDSCCNATTDENIRTEYFAFIDETKYPDCADFMKQHRCALCDDWAGHLFDFEGTQTPRTDTLQCPDHCKEVWSACKDAYANFNGTNATFSSVYGSEAAYCNLNTDPTSFYCYPWDPSILDIPSELNPAFPNLDASASTLSNLVELVLSNDGNRFYALNRAGTVYTFPNNPNVSSSDLKVFLNINSLVESGNSGEQGLLGFALDPDFDTNKYFYVSYIAKDGTNEGTSTIARYTADNSTSADINSNLTILTVKQPATNHNGGKLSFKPDDGHRLFIAFGDGGGGGDTYHNGQNRDTILAKILRIDVSASSAATPYTVPDDNPWATGGGVPEMWAWGLRNPWKFSFDPQPPHDMWLADVGQSDWEEINIVHKGDNMGWPILEGVNCYPPSVESCNRTGLVNPVYNYPHTTAGCFSRYYNFTDCGDDFNGISVSGGVKYRGTGIPALTDTYLFADYGSNKVWSWNSVTNRTTYLRNAGKVSGFAFDKDGEFLIYDLDGHINKFPANFIPPNTTFNESTTTGSTTTGSATTTGAATTGAATTGASATTTGAGTTTANGGTTTTATTTDIGSGEPTTAGSGADGSSEGSSSLLQHWLQFL